MSSDNIYHRKINKTERRGGDGMGESVSLISPKGNQS